MKRSFKKVPALEKGLNILKLVADSEHPLGLTDMAKVLNYNLSTVYNIAYTFVDLGYFESDSDKKFSLGRKFYELGRSAIKDPELINLVHPYLVQINEKTKLSVFLSVRSGLYSVIVDKVESTFDIKISLEVGRRITLLAGAAGKALMSQLPDPEIEKILSEGELIKYTPSTCVDKKKYKEMVLKVRKEGAAISNGEFTEEICAFASPLNTGLKLFPAAIGMMGLKSQINKKDHTFYLELIKKNSQRNRKTDS